MACGYEALKRAGISVAEYYASEIDPYAIKIAKKNHPDIKHIGSITEWRTWPFTVGYFDLIIGGSPCQGFSTAGRGLNFDDPRSKLYFEFEDIIKTLKPKRWLLENVRMKKEWADIITQRLGVTPVLINSALVSAQNRERLYWANFPIRQPEDRGILLKDIVLPNTWPVVVVDCVRVWAEKNPRIFENKSPTLRTPSGGARVPYLVNALMLSEKEREYMDREVKGGRTHWDFQHHSDTENDKAAACVANFFKGVPYNVLIDRTRDKCGFWTCDFWDDDSSCAECVECDNYQGSNTVPTSAVRKFHPIECERLQTLPDNYTEGVSNTQRYKMIGNGWTVEVITHIFKEMLNA
jgi:DNA (cytosine-5)-methyltransferase 3A